MERNMQGVQRLLESQKQLWSAIRRKGGRVLAVVLPALIILSSILLPGGVAQASAGPQLTVVVDALNLRSGPGTNYAIIGAVHRGDVATITGRDAGSAWYQVNLSGGQAGWVSGSATLVQVSGDTSGLPVVAVAAPVAAAPSASAVAGAPIIVFQTSSGGAIYAISPNGRGLRQLTTGIDPALSPDRQWVAYTRWDGAGDGATGSLWVIKADGSGERKVIGNLRNPKSPTWSPDGQKIIVNVQAGGIVKPLYLCFARGQRPVQSPTPIDGMTCISLTDPYWGLTQVDVATGAFKDLPRDRHSFAPTWDPIQAWHVIYRATAGLANLDVNQDTTWPLTSDTQQRAPVFSPDGKKIALSYWQHDHWEVHVMNADGSAEARLTETPASVLVDAQLKGESVRVWNNAAPAWSPDGSQIAFLTDRTGSWDIWVMNADGSNQRPLFPAGTLAGLKIEYHGVDERVISWR